MNTATRIVGLAALMLALPTLAGEATKTPTAGITLPPRSTTQVGISRTAVQDSTLAGEAAWNPTGTRITYCQMNPTAKVCGSGGTGDPPNPPAAVVAGCYVDTFAWDPFQPQDVNTTATTSAPTCSGAGDTSTDAVVFSVGDTINGNGTGDAAYFANPSAYNVVWSGACAGKTGSLCTVVVGQFSDWKQAYPKATATVYRTSDGSLVGFYGMVADKYTRNCLDNNANALPCPDQP